MNTYNKKEAVNVIIDATDLTNLEGTNLQREITNAKVLPHISNNFDTIAIDYADGSTRFIQWSYNEPRLIPSQVDKQFTFSDN